LARLQLLFALILREWFWRDCRSGGDQEDKEEEEDGVMVGGYHGFTYHLVDVLFDYLWV